MPNGTFVETDQTHSQRRSWGALSHKDFRRFWLARTASAAGDSISQFAIPTAAILVLGAGPAQVGVIRALGLLAYPLLGLVAGVWVDRLRRRRIMVVADAGRALALASIPVAFGLGHLTIAQLYVVVALVGTLTVFFDLASTSHVPVLVPRADWASANAQLEMAQQAIGTGGPGLAGVLISTFSAPLSIAVNAATYVISATLLRATADPVLPASPRRHAAAEALEGMRFLIGHGALRRITITAAVSNVGLFTAQAVVLLFLYRVAHLPAYVIGLAFGAGALASFVGAAANQPIVARLRTHRSLLVATFVEGLGWMLIPAGLFFPAVPFLVGGLVVAGFAGVTWNVSVTTFRQHQIPPELMGRVSAAARTIGYGALPVGSVFGGFLGQALTAVLGQARGLTVTLAIGGLIAAASALPLLGSKDFAADV